MRPAVAEAMDAVKKLPPIASLLPSYASLGLPDSLIAIVVKLRRMLEVYLLLPDEPSGMFKVDYTFHPRFNYPVLPGTADVLTSPIFKRGYVSSMNPTTLMSADEAQVLLDGLKPSPNLPQSIHKVMTNILIKFLKLWTTGARMPAVMTSAPRPRIEDSIHDADHFPIELSKALLGMVELQQAAAFRQPGADPKYLVTRPEDLIHRDVMSGKTYARPGRIDLAWEGAGAFNPHAVTSLDNLPRLLFMTTRNVLKPGLTHADFLKLVTLRLHNISITVSTYPPLVIGEILRLLNYRPAALAPIARTPSLPFPPNPFATRIIPAGTSAATTIGTTPVFAAAPTPAAPSAPAVSGPPALPATKEYLSSGLRDAFFGPWYPPSTQTSSAFAPFVKRTATVGVRAPAPTPPTLPQLLEQVRGLPVDEALKVLENYDEDASTEDEEPESAFARLPDEETTEEEEEDTL